jgi:type IV pilus assembly protein PilM
VARRVIGLDVGTNAVRVAEIAVGPSPVLRAFGQVALPPEAMREGEIVDPGAVTAAIERLWRELGLRKGDVRVGIASPRVIVRPVELPAMPEDDLAGALRFQAQELIPIPIEEAVFDFQVLDTMPPVEGEEGTGTSRVLLAAAHRETVNRLVDAVRAAGLRVGAVDVVPLALVRALAAFVTDDTGPGAEAIVSIGGGTTVVVVHEAGLPRFVRILGAGGRVLTDAVARELDLPAETAESVKRQGDLAPDDLGAHARTAIERPLNDLLEEVRSSIDYYRTQPGAAPLRRALLTGGSSRLTGIVDRLSSVLGVPVEEARPRDNVVVGDIGFPPEELPALDPYLAVPIGLALGGVGTTRRIDLTTVVRRVEIDRRLVGALAACLVALLVLLGFLTAKKSSDVSNAKDDLQTVQQSNTRLQSEITRLGGVQADQRQVEAMKTQVTQLLQGDVSWGTLLQGIARVIPNDVWLTGFQGTQNKATAAAPSSAANTAAGISGSAATTSTTGSTSTTAASGATTSTTGAGAVPAGGPTGTITFSGMGLDFTSVASWIQRLSGVPALSDVWVSSASRQGSQGQAGQTTSGQSGQQTVTFSSTATFNANARSDRLQQLQQGNG